MQMWSSAQLKQRAKSNLRRNYWTAFVVSLIVTFLGGGLSGVNSYFNMSMNSFNSSDNISSAMLEAMRIMVPLMLLFSLISLFYSIFVAIPVQVGGSRWYLRSRESAEAPSIGTVFSTFKKGGYLKIVGGMLWVNLFVFLWMLPFIFLTLIMSALPPVMAGFIYSPNNHSFGTIIDEAQAALIGFGILFAILFLAYIFAIIVYIAKVMSYMLTPWILADNPNIGFRRALQLSKNLTRGHKGHILVLGFSFTAWALLAIPTCGLSALFLQPYIQATYTELYIVLRQNGVDSGLCTMEEFGYIKASKPVSLPPETAAI